MTKKLIKSVVKDDSVGYLKGKTSKRSTKRTKVTDITPYSQEYLCMFSWRMKPVSEAFLDHLAQELLNWSIGNDDALKMSQFYTLKGIDKDDMARWCVKNENVNKAFNRAKAVIGDRREIGALKSKYNTAMVQYMMPHYDGDWKDMAEWKAKLNKIDEMQNGGTKVVIVDRYVE